MGVRSPNGWCRVDHCEIPWEEIYSKASDIQTARRIQPVVCLHDAGNGSQEFR